MISKEQAQKALTKCGGNKTHAAKLLNIPRSTLRTALGCIKHNTSTKNKKHTLENNIPVIKKGKSLSEFKQQYDKDFIIPNRVKEALKAMGSSWEYESVFVKMAGVSIADLSNYRDQFSDFIVTIKRDNKRVWAGTKAIASQLREMV